MFYTIEVMEQVDTSIKHEPYDIHDPQSILYYLNHTPYELVFTELTPRQRQGLMTHPDERVRDAYYVASYRQAQDIVASSIKTAAKLRNR